MEGDRDNRIVLRENSAEQSDTPSGQTLEQPRQPRNMEDLLRYAIEVESQGSPGASPSSRRPLDAQRRQFLETVMSSMTVDVIQELKDSLEILQRDYKPGDDTEIFEQALDRIVEFTDNIDNAIDFFKLKGFDVCKTWLEKGPPGVRWRAAEVIAECCQNNIFCQSKATQTGLLKQLMEITQNDPDDTVKIKTFRAVSCIVRNNDYTLLNFLTLNGHKLILYCLKSPNNRLKTKAAFLTSAIANKEDMLREQLWDIGVVNELVTLISNAQDSKLVEDVSCFEQCLSAFLCLVKEKPKNLKENAIVLDSLNRLQKNLSEQPAYRESVGHIKSILRVIQSE